MYVCLHIHELRIETETETQVGFARFTGQKPPCVTVYDRSAANDLFAAGDRGRSEGFSLRNQFTTMKKRLFLLLSLFPLVQ